MLGANGGSLGCKGGRAPVPALVLMVCSSKLISWEALCLTSWSSFGSSIRSDICPPSLKTFEFVTLFY